MPEARRIERPAGEKPTTISFEGRSIEAWAGATVASALAAAGVEAFRHDREGGPRMPFCNMGTCFECTMAVDGRRLTRTCMTVVREGMTVARECPR